jgi:hypothetical protein
MARVSSEARAEFRRGPARETDRPGDKETERHTERERERGRERQTDRQTDGKRVTDRDRDRETEREREEEREKHHSESLERSQGLDLVGDEREHVRLDRKHHQVVQPADLQRPRESTDTPESQLPTYLPTFLSTVSPNYLPIYLTPWHPYLQGYLAHKKTQPPLGPS